MLHSSDDASDSPHLLPRRRVMGAAAAGSPAHGSFHWTPGKVVLSLVLFVWAGFAEIGGGWLVWQAVRCSCGPVRWADHCLWGESCPLQPYGSTVSYIPPL